MKIQSIVFSNDGAQVTYLEDHDVHPDTGCIDWTVREIPHALIPQDMLDDLQDSVRTIVDHVSIANRNPRYEDRGDGQAQGA